MTVYFEWDEAEDNVDEEIDENGNMIVGYTTEPIPFGNIISQYRDGTTSTFHHDGIGSTIAVTNGNGDVSDTRAYSAFGRTTYTSGSTVFPFQYVGKKGYYFDSDTDDYYIRQRSYQPHRGRWLQREPIESIVFVGYRYAQNCPLAMIDPQGLTARFIKDDTKAKAIDAGESSQLCAIAEIENDCREPIDTKRKTARPCPEGYDPVADYSADVEPEDYPYIKWCVECNPVSKYCSILWCSGYMMEQPPDYDGPDILLCRCTKLA